MRKCFSLFFLLFAWIFCSMLTACTAATQGKEIIRVYDDNTYQHTKSLLLDDLGRHGIVTEDLPTANPFALLGREWGGAVSKKLYERLSLSFRYPSKEESKYWTFADMYADMGSEKAETNLYSYGFVQEYGLEKTTVTLLGDLYWDKNQIRDWLVYCRIEEMQTKNRQTKNDVRHAREYYLVITDRTSRYWQAEPILIRDLNVYSTGQESYVHKDLTMQKQLQLEPSLAVDFEAGQSRLLQAPQNNTQKKNGAKDSKDNQGQGKQKNLQEQSLSE